jgi:uncharacterized protein YyaL (SSP411 family)
VEALLGPEDAGVFRRFYDVTEGGNFEGDNILHIPKPPHQFCEEEGSSQEVLLETLERSRVKLFRAREKRIKPGLDDKILTSWNGLMIGSMAVAGRGEAGAAYLAAARRAADFVLTRMRGERGLLRTHRAGQSRLNAYLDDYAFMMMGLLDLYESSFETKWLDEAAALAREVIARFWDEGEGAFFFTSNDHEELIVRKKTAQDGAIPSGNSVAALALCRLGKLTGEAAFTEKGQGVIRVYGELLDRAPGAFHMMLVALDFDLGTPVEVAIAGDPASADTQAALDTVNSVFAPNKVVALRAPSDDAEIEKKIPLLAGKEVIGGVAAVYLCRNYTCDAPLTDLTAVRERLAEM